MNVRALIGSMSMQCVCVCIHVVLIGCVDVAVLMSGNTSLHEKGGPLHVLSVCECEFVELA